MYRNGPKAVNLVVDYYETLHPRQSCQGTMALLVRDLVDALIERDINAEPLMVQAAHRAHHKRKQREIALLLEEVTQMDLDGDGE
jgi:hypothetical protein